MSKRILMLLAFTLALILAGCGQTGDVKSSAADTENGAAQIELATNFSLASLNGDQVTLSDLRGRYVLVNFWATWCIPCRKEMPYLEKISVEHSDQLTVLAINMNEDSDRVRPFIEEAGFTYPILLDPSDKLAIEHNVRGLPVSFIVGPDGDIVYRRIGEILPEEFDLWLEENLGS